MRVLVVEDEERIAEAIKRGLELESFAVDVAHDGEYGLDLASTVDYEVIILDLMLPVLDGVSLCKKLREGGRMTAILMLTAKGQLEDKVDGLNAGADDYLVKPFAFEELLARVRALARRPREGLQQVLRVDDLALDTVTRKVTRAQSSVSLSRREYALLTYLMSHPGQVLTKSQIIESVWGFDADVLPNTVEVYIGYLRNKVDRAFPRSAPLIQTVRGFGYKIGAGT